MMIQLDDSTVKRLRVLQRAHKDKRVFVKVTVLLMLHQGCTPQFVADFVAYSGQLSEDEEPQLVEEVRLRLYINNKQVAAYVEREFGIRYSLSAVVKLLRRLGFTYKKTKGVGVKANREAQEAFVQELSELLAQKDANCRVVGETTPKAPGKNHHQHLR
jgi:hypothetical protein